jgi:hypothetical protein
MVQRARGQARQACPHVVSFFLFPILFTVVGNWSASVNRLIFCALESEANRLAHIEKLTLPATQKIIVVVRQRQAQIYEI